MSHLVKWAALGLLTVSAFEDVVTCMKDIVEDASSAGRLLTDDDRDTMVACCGGSAWESDDLSDISYSAQDDLYVQFQAQEMAGQTLCETKMRNTYMYLKGIGRSGGPMMPAADAAAVAAGPVNLALTLMRKFRNLKAMVMVLQPANITIFGRYCYYGCWCLPNGQHNLAAGFGQPVDPIDEVCKEFALCYKCIDIDFAGTCNQETRGYQWARNRVGGITVDVTCKNNPSLNVQHRCARYLCECDRMLAVGLGMFHWYWNISFHARWGSFDRLANCFPGGGAYRQDACCGGYGTATPYWGSAWVSMRRPYASSNPATACCQDVFYYDFLNEDCCLDSTNKVVIVPKGTCDNTVLPPDDDSYTTTTPATTTTTTTTAVVEACTGVDLDIIFIVDGSGSVTQANFDLTNAFLKDFVADMGVGPSNTNPGIFIAYVQYAGTGTATTEFSYNNDLATIETKIDGIVFLNGGTATGKALTYTNNNLISGGRNGVNKVCILFTDGQSGDSVTAPAGALRTGCTVFAVGIGGGVDINELNDIATDPDGDHVFSTTFGNLAALTQAVGTEVCGNADAPDGSDSSFDDSDSPCDPDQSGDGC